MLRAYLAGTALVLLVALSIGCGHGGVSSPESEAPVGQSYSEADMSYSYTEEAAAAGGASYAGPATNAQPAPAIAATPVPKEAMPDNVRFAASPPKDEKRVGSAIAATDAWRQQQINESLRQGNNGDRYSQIVENDFVSVSESPLSTFSIDVDTASYAKTRMYLQQHNRLPPADAVRIEELVNYFDYEYSPPTGEDPFAVHMEVARAPWQPRHLLARVGLKGREMTEQRPTSNLVFLIDVSGSMNRPNKLGLVKQGLQLLTSQLNDEDRVSIVVYAGAAGLVLPPTHGDNRQVILDAVSRLSAGGSTNGGQGIQLAYQVARQNFIEGGVNRVLLCTDGDFNVGTTNTGDLVRLAETQARDGVYLSVLGFGMGNHNDAMLEQLSNKANGNYAFIDSDREARKVLLDQLDSTLVTIAKDVKIQIEFNPLYVESYRLIGYENRHLEDRDFNDDKKDAGEIGAGHTVTALYELVMADREDHTADPQVDALKYQTPRKLADAADSDDLLNLKLRFKRPSSDRSELAVFPVKHSPLEFGQATKDFQFAAAVAEFGMLLRNSKHRGDASYAEVLEIAGSSRGKDGHGLRSEFLNVVSTARRLVEPEAAAAAIDVPQIVYDPQLAPMPHVVNPRHTQSVSLLLVTVAVAVWLILAVIGCMVIAWAVLSRRDRQTWDVEAKSTAKMARSSMV